MRIPLFTVAILGLLVAGYLAVVYNTGGPILCSTGGCEIIRATKYSHMFGISTPLYGIVFYVLLAIGAMVWRPDASKNLQWALYLLTAIGLAVSIVLTYIEAFIVHAWCLWCVGSAILALVAFILVWFMQPRYAAINGK